jgi:hypothetical protein
LRRKPTTSKWADIAAAIDSLGGTSHVVNTLDGSGGYAFVGCAGCPRWPSAQEASFPLTKPYGVGRLHGRLALNDNSQWASSLSDLGGGFDYGVADIFSQPPSSWPCGLAASSDIIPPPCDGYQAALDWITDQVLPAKDYPPDSSWCQQVRTFRNAYCSATQAWNTRSARSSVGLAARTAPASPASTARRFSASCCESSAGARP